ncbi:MAG: cation transporter [Gammaproteobacteria bacterium]|nr:MAG: cation transporter [Gammaproteobacteria bacterium]
MPHSHDQHEQDHDQHDPDDHNHSEHDHGHGHSHAHHHHTLPTNHDRSFTIAVILNAVFVVIEFTYGFLANSTALMADAGHNLSDVLGLILAWSAAILARKAPNARYTYGLRNSSILAALANATLLLVACGAIALEAIQRFAEPPAVAGLTVTIVAGVGIAVNTISALLFMKGSKHDINIRGAYLHMAADAAVSLGVVIAGVAMIFTGWYWLDPALSLVIVVVIVVASWGLLRESLQLALNAVPASIDINKVETFLRKMPGVSDIHDLHIWGLSTTESALTVHLVMPGGYPGDAALTQLSDELKSRFSIHHSTLQFEQGSITHSCSLHPD